MTMARILFADDNVSRILSMYIYTGSMSGHRAFVGAFLAAVLAGVIACSSNQVEPDQQPPGRIEVEFVTQESRTVGALSWEGGWRFVDGTGPGVASIKFQDTVMYSPVPVIRDDGTYVYKFDVGPDLHLRSGGWRLRLDVQWLSGFPGSGSTGCYVRVYPELTTSVTFIYEQDTCVAEGALD